MPKSLQNRRFSAIFWLRKCHPVSRLPNALLISVLVLQVPTNGDTNMGLSAVAVRNAKGRERAYKLSDSGGLHLFVQPNGGRYWRCAYRWDGQQRTAAFGVYPDV